MRYVCAISAVAFLVAAGPVAAQSTSGFLGDSYAKLADAQSPSGRTVKRWLDPAVASGKFEFLLVDKTVFYPEPRSTEQLSAATLAQIRAYLDDALRRELTGLVKLASEPGPRTLRLRPAITAAAAKDLGLKPYQYLPIAFVLTAGKTSHGATLAVEYELQDTETNQVVGAGMRQGTGLELKSAQEKLTVAHFKPIIDEWAKDLRAFVEAARGKN
ncbi:MAG: DUF3313 domain-containing protein [Burkholderiales bacterium]|nr:DUF3313 domain-containing protein [Burkholderiales bacterium]